MKRLDKNLKTILERTCKRVEASIASINRGGCGVFALLLGEKLERLGLRVEYKYIVRYREGRASINNAINENNTNSLNATSWCHVVLKVNGRYYIDAENIATSAKAILEASTIIPGAALSDSVPRELVEEHVDMEWVWNPTFNRKKEIPRIKRILEAIK